ncbi:hypothetical protein CPC08DRAFT_644056 [Agrocybe pediades]|nr:hypothetical protein CPC08DRAFT_644056 [Agrocybe pediades]
MLFATRITFLTAGLLAVNAAQSVSKNSTSTPTGVVANTTLSAAPPNASGIFGGLSPCALECVEGAAVINNCTVTDVSCLCSSAQLQADAEACLTIHCTDDDQDAVGSLQDEQCAAGMMSSFLDLPYLMSYDGCL